MNVKSIAIAKNESAYLPEWEHHHFYFGFDAIHIIYNQCTDNTVDILNEHSMADDLLSYNSGDELIEMCRQKNLNFQREAYKEARFASNDQFSHIMFLDLEEFWMPVYFSHSINPYIRNAGHFDSISLDWHTDLPDLTKKFNGAIERSLNLQKSRNLKSISSTCKISVNVGIHNCTFFGRSAYAV